MNIFQKIYNRIFPKRFHRFYNKIKNNKNLDKDLIYISDIFINSESYETVSNQWHILNIKDYKTLLDSSINKLGINVFNHYFNFYDYKSEHLVNLFNEIQPNDILNLNSNRNN